MMEQVLVCTKTRILVCTNTHKGNVFGNEHCCWICGSAFRSQLHRNLAAMATNGQMNGKHEMNGHNGTNGPTSYLKARTTSLQFGESLSSFSPQDRPSLEMINAYFFTSRRALSNIALPAETFLKYCQTRAARSFILSSGRSCDENKFSTQTAFESRSVLSVFSINVCMNQQFGRKRAV